MTEGLLKTLLHQSESETLDFKRDQYPFSGADNTAKSELVKDILAFANAWKTADAHILIGVDENPGGVANVLGIQDHLSDADLQQLVNTKTNHPVRFSYEAITYEGDSVGVITVSKDQDRPIFLTKDFGKLKKNVVYIRRSSSTAEADPTEIAEMGKASAEAAVSTPTLTVEFGDPEARKGLGTQIQSTSVLLVDPPPPPPPSPMDEATKVLIKANSQYKGITEIMRSMGSLGRLGDLPGTFQPKPDEVRQYHEDVARLRSVAIAVRNTSGVVATGVKVEITGQMADGFEVCDVSEAPEEPSGIYGVRIPNIHGTVNVYTHGTEWRAVIDVGKLQPKAKYWTDADLFFGATKPVSVDATATIYADNLSQPIVVPLVIAIDVAEEIYSPGDEDGGG